MFLVVTVETSGLGDRSYVVGDGEVAVVVDPQRDIDRLQQALRQVGGRLTHVLETHIHNDYVTGGLQLADAAGAAYLVAAADDVAFDRTGARPGDEVSTGSLTIRVLATPGHTPTHLSYVVAQDGHDRAVFTGGSLLYGTVGRTDLIADGRTEELTRAQYRSARMLIAQLAADVEVYPTHGFGSFCSSASGSGGPSGTIADERRANLAALAGDEETFVAQLIGGLTAYPRYYARMAPINRAGPAPVDLTPPAELDPAELGRRIHAGQWVVDLRTRRAFAHHHLHGTVNIGLDGAFATYLGWVLPWGDPVTLVGDTADEVAAAQRELVRIGVDRPAGQATGGPDRYAVGADPRAYAVADFGELAETLAADPAAVTVLDVRRDDEWARGHLVGALHIPLPDLEARAGELPSGDAMLWVHCQSGFRAAIGASLLDRAGRRVVLIDDSFDHTAAAGLHLTT